MNNYDPNYVSKKTFFLVGQKAIITNKKNQILLLQRSGKTTASGKWALTGGALEEGETPIDGIKREIEEETKLTVSDIASFQIKTTPSKDSETILIICYTCKADTEEVTLNWEHDNFKWVTKAEALELDLTPDGRTFIGLL